MMKINIQGHGIILVKSLILSENVNRYIINSKYVLTIGEYLRAVKGI